MMRLSAATLLAGAAVATMAPHLTSYISSSAVVNAPLLSVRAPFDGLLDETSRAFANAVAPGELLLRLEGERQDQDALAAVQAEIRGLTAALAHMDPDNPAVPRLEARLDRALGRARAWAATTQGSHTATVGA